ncbi:FAD binding domain-containing protein [Gluconacetobacter azotocaptans]|uniref:FAD binding domain-containing protein n=1 Tax=Gluconacetobacter azotocaptans TaxID=142834 RepID=UPI00195ED3F4|nr:FAD binding domain-containing protein [Gluconacetobacter azotocaptans]MBM9401470.1 FAD binding domain-containing protein [Gluconacetobacter azotocaptans]
MKPAPFAYHRAQSLDHLLRLKADLRGDGIILAGGQSLVPMLNLRLSRPGNLIDINDLVELDHVHARDGMLRIGAMVRHHRIATHPLVRRHHPLVAGMASMIGYHAIRQRGTIGGSLTLADPSAHFPLAAMLCDATLVLRSTRGERSVPYRALYLSPLNCALEDDEIVRSVLFPIPPPGCRMEAEIFHLNHGGFPLAACAVALTADARGGVATLTLVIAAGGLRPVVLDRELDGFLGAGPDAGLPAAIAGHVAAILPLEDTAKAPAAYLSAVVRRCATLCVTRALAPRAGEPA